MSSANRNLTLPVTSTVIIVVVVALALLAMVFVLARSNRSAGGTHSQAGRVERADRRVPGIDPEAAIKHADAVGDEYWNEEGVEPGGHSVPKPRD
jgi:hypothetical protein